MQRFSEASKNQRGKRSLQDPWARGSEHSSTPNMLSHATKHAIIAIHCVIRYFCLCLVDASLGFETPTYCDQEIFSPGLWYRKDCRKKIGYRRAQLIGGDPQGT